MTAMTKFYGLLALRGVASLLFGLLTFFWPVHMLIALIFLFAAYALTDGLFALWGAFHARGRRRLWGSLLAEGVIGIGFGLFTLGWWLWMARAREMRRATAHHIRPGAARCNVSRLLNTLRVSALVF